MNLEPMKEVPSEILNQQQESVFPQIAPTSLHNIAMSSEDSFHRNCNNPVQSEMNIEEKEEFGSRVPNFDMAHRVDHTSMNLSDGAGVSGIASVNFEKSEPKRSLEKSDVKNETPEEKEKRLKKEMML